MLDAQWHQAQHQSLHIQRSLSMAALRFSSALAALVLVVAGCSEQAPTATPSGAADDVRPGFTLPDGAVAMMHLQAKMRDGVRLDTSVWLPAKDGKFPVVLIRTPYKTEMWTFQSELLKAGYAVVQQHERGRFLSEGEMRMLGMADEDGWDTLDWIVAQPWSNGAIGAQGDGRRLVRRRHRAGRAAQ
jgi:predicted acyl esterase